MNAAILLGGMASGLLATVGLHMWALSYISFDKPADPEALLDEYFNARH